MAKKQSVNDAAVTGAGIDLTLVDVDGKDAKLVMHALRDVDLVELDEWVRGKIMDVALDTCRRVKDASQRDELMRSALRCSATATFMSGDGKQLIQSVDGLARMLWQSAKPKGMTVDALRALLPRRDNLARVIATFNRFKLLGDDDKDEPDDPNAERPTAE